MAASDPDEAVARQLVALFGTAGQNDDLPVPDMAAASRITARVREMREARGERVRGRKIGFSNRGIWARYNVDRPMWNYVWDTTVSEASGAEAGLDVAGFPEPRIEPEIVLRLGRAPEPGMDEAALLDCIDAVAHGFEIVQSVYPGWRFTAPQSAAAMGLHGALVIGPWRDIGRDRAGWGAMLADFTVTLSRDGVPLETGHASNVLDGPMTALRYLVGTIAGDPLAPALEAGEIVSTGTLTDAWPATAGSVWSTEFEGITLPGLRVTCR